MAPATEEATYAWELEGRWLALNYSLKGPEIDPPVVSTVAHETFDEKLGRWVYISTSSDGRYGISYSTGWRAGVKVYGPMVDGVQPWELVATRVGEREFTEEIRVREGQRWRSTFRLHCLKAG